MSGEEAAKSEGKTAEPPLPDMVSSRLLSQFYGDLRRAARRTLGRSEYITLQPTEIVHAAALRLLESSGVWIRDETHMLALSVRVIRATVIDEVRRRKASKRNIEAVTLWDEAGGGAPLDILDFDELLEALSAFEPEGARIVELRFYAGMTMGEIAEALDMPERTVHRRWASARAWLQSELAPG